MEYIHNVQYFETDKMSSQSFLRHLAVWYLHNTIWEEKQCFMTW